MIKNTTFKEFFKIATGFEPYPYQEVLADTSNIPEILSVPTGAGKTEAAILAIYIWRCIHSDENICKNTPRRLVYCLPMRVLVEQTVDRIEKWIRNLKLENKIKVVTIMGGHVDTDYKLYPEDYTIIIGTQDMLLSRALNRGYAMSQFQWPIEFGLLNNDCLWIMDEIQLMHNGLVTSVQLEQFRNKMNTYGPHRTMWMSATINPQWLKTVDSDPSKYTKLNLTEKDSEHKLLSKRNNAKKTLKELKLLDHKDEYTKNDAMEIKNKHDGGITLVIVNTVKRAQNLFKELKNIVSETEIMLVHSRYRQKERHALNERLNRISQSPDQKQDMIIVSTQVVEAGVDISAKTLITEMAPWPSMVQRFGRCNRKGEYDDSTVYFIRLAEKQYIPYEEKDMLLSEERLDQRINKSISPKEIPQIDETITHELVIRESDMLQLFDTTPDLSGSHTDVSRFVRSLEATKDVSVLWREWDENQLPEKDKIRSEEICSVSISEIKKFMKNHKVWKYDHIDGIWQKVYDVYPGQTYLIHAKSGGYKEELGWDVTSKNNVTQITKELKKNSENREMEESNGSDNSSQNIGWITLNDHTVHVIDKIQKILEKIEHLSKINHIMITVAKYHDIGKAHKVFQGTMLKGMEDKISKDVLWAKRSGNANHSRRNFRHEAASALAFLKMHASNTETELVAYLIASHHGKIRISMRDLPKKKHGRYINSDDNHLCGIPIEEKETIPIFLSDKRDKSKENNTETILNESVENEIDIDASIARIGKKDDVKSWLQITLGLLKEHGPFRLAYLEAVIRAADSRASRDEDKNNE